MERAKILERSTEESLGIEEAVCMKSVVRNWRDPYPSLKGKEKAYKLGEIVFLIGGSRKGNIVPTMTVQEKRSFMGRFLTSFMFVERVRVRECHAD